MTRILLIGPFPKPISGVALANKVVKKTLDKKNDFEASTINTSLPFFEESIGSFSIKKLFFNLGLNFKAIKIFSADKVYITPGQTFFGVTKYSLFILMSSLLGKELIIHVHGNYLGTQYQLLNGLKKKYFKFLLSRFHKGIVLSLSLKNNLTPFLKEENIFILNNFAQSFLYKDELKKDFRELKITYLSNLMEEKGILYLLEALKELEDNGVNYKAKIAGNIDDSLKEIIEKKLSQLKNTSYLGVVYSDKKKALLEWSNIFVLPTFYKMEGQPISILEALATQNLIITTNHSGIPDIIESEINGYIVQPKNSVSIKEKLSVLSKDISKLKTICEHNKQYFLDNFTLEHFESEIIKILNADSAIK